MAMTLQYTEDFEGTLGNWDVFTNGGQTIDLVATNVIAGAKSLRLLAPDPSASRGNLLPTIASGLAPAALSGKTRALFRKVVQGGGVTILGFSAMQSQRDITTGGACYVGGYSIGGQALTIRKATGSGLSGLTLLATASISWTSGTIIGLEFEWNTAGGSAVLTVRMGTMTDFSDLADTVTYTDTSSPLLTSVGQGLCYAAPAFSSAPEKRADTVSGYLNTVAFARGHDLRGGFQRGLRGGFLN